MKPGRGLAMVYGSIIIDLNKTFDKYKKPTIGLATYKKNVKHRKVPNVERNIAM
jgi:uncharacterized protein YijF (DUF1287 family)